MSGAERIARGCLLGLLLLLAACSEPEPEPSPLIEFRDAHRTLPEQQGEVIDVWSSRLMLFYSEHLEAETFHATLNGADVTPLFHPHAGRFEAADMKEHLHLGRNELLIEVAPRLADGRIGQPQRYALRIERKVFASPSYMVGVPSSPPPLP